MHNIFYYIFNYFKNHLHAQSSYELRYKKELCKKWGNYFSPFEATVYHATTLGLHYYGMPRLRPLLLSTYHCKKLYNNWPKIGNNYNIFEKTSEYFFYIASNIGFFDVFIELYTLYNYEERYLYDIKYLIANSFSTCFFEYSMDAMCDGSLQVISETLEDQYLTHTTIN